MTLKQIQNVRVMRIRHDREKVRVLLQRNRRKRDKKTRAKLQRNEKNKETNRTSIKTEIICNMKTRSELINKWGSKTWRERSLNAMEKQKQKMTEKRQQN